MAAGALGPYVQVPEEKSQPKSSERRKLAGNIPVAAKQLPAISFSRKPPPCLRAALHACACVRACACVAYAAVCGSVTQSCLF